MVLVNCNTWKHTTYIILICHILTFYYFSAQFHYLIFTSITLLVLGYNKKKPNHRRRDADNLQR